MKNIVSIIVSKGILETVFKPIYDNSFLAILINFYSENNKDKISIGFMNFLCLLVANYFISFVFSTLIFEKMLTEMGYTDSVVMVMLIGLAVLTSELVGQIIKLSIPHYLGIKLWINSQLPLH